MFCELVRICLYLCSMINPEPNTEVLIFAPDWSSYWDIGWMQSDGKWYVDPKDEPVRCLTDEGCEVVHWQYLPPIPEPWRTWWSQNPY